MEFLRSSDRNKDVLRLEQGFSRLKVWLEDVGTIVESGQCLSGTADKLDFVRSVSGKISDDREISDGQGQELVFNGQPFFWEMFWAISDKKDSLPVFIIYPDGDQSYFARHLLQDIGEKYAEAWMKLLHSIGDNDNDNSLFNIPFFCIFTQRNFVYPSGNPPSGWVNDFGPFVMTHFSGLDGLSGREAGTYTHEAVHRFFETTDPKNFFRMLGQRPHLDEAFAIAGEILTTSSSQLHLGLPVGISQSYLHTLSSSDITKPEGFNFLDGKDKNFDHDPYNQRMLFALFIIALMSGFSPDVSGTINDPSNDPSKYIEGMLKGGLVNFINNDDDEKFDRLKSDILKKIIFGVLEAISDKGNDNGLEEEDVFWCNLLGMPATSNMTLLLENLYKKYGVLTLYYWMVRNTSNADEIKRLYDNSESSVIRVLYDRARALGVQPNFNNHIRRE